MAKNTTAITHGAMLAKHGIAQRQQQGQAAGIVKIDAPNRQQRRAAKKKGQQK